MSRDAVTKIYKQCATFVLLTTLAAAGLSSCSKPPPPAPEDYLPSGKIKVVASTVQLAELAREIGGDAVVVECLLVPPAPAKADLEKAASKDPEIRATAPELPPWTPNPFAWNIRANDLFSMRTAHVVVLNGLGLEKISESQLESLAAQNVIVAVAGNAMPQEEHLLTSGPGSPEDPCIWNSPRIWKYAVQATRDALKKCVRPEAQPYFEDRAHSVEDRMDRLAEWTESKLAESNAKGNRFLLSSHATLRYFGRDFGIETRALLAGDGTAIPNAETELPAWIATKNVTDLFPDSTMSTLDLNEAALRLKLGHRDPIHSIYPAPPGTKKLGFMDSYDVGTQEGAFRHMVRMFERHLGAVVAAPAKLEPAAEKEPAPAATSK